MRKQIFVIAISALVLAGCDQAPISASTGTSSENTTEQSARVGQSAGMSASEERRASRSRPAQIMIFDAWSPFATGAPLEATRDMLCEADRETRKKVEQRQLDRISAKLESGEFSDSRASQARDKVERVFEHPDFACMASVMNDLHAARGGWTVDPDDDREAAEDWVRWRVAAGIVVAEIYEKAAVEVTGQALPYDKAINGASNVLDAYDEAFWDAVVVEYQRLENVDFSINEDSQTAPIEAIADNGWVYRHGQDGFELERYGITYYSDAEIYSTKYTVDLSRGEAVSMEISDETAAGIAAKLAKESATRVGAAQ